MPEYQFDRESVKRGLNLVRIVKPAVGDISFSFSPTGLTLFSYDSRRYTRIEVPPVSTDAPDSFKSDEFYVFLDKSAIFDTELDNLQINVDDSALHVVASGGGQTRRSTLKKRSLKSRRPEVPSFPALNVSTFPKAAIDELLRSVACSAAIKDGKSEDDMRVYQIHFYANGHAASMTKFHASVCEMPGLDIDASIVSLDIPSVRAFLSRIKNDSVGFAQDKDRVYFIDPHSRSFLALSKVAGERPKFDAIDDKFETAIRLDQSLLSRNLAWATLVLERTQRIHLSAVLRDGNQGSLSLSFQNQQADGIPITFIRGSKLEVDIPADKFRHIIGFIDGDVVLKYHHSTQPVIMEISPAEKNSDVSSWHYIASMKSNGT